VKCEDVTGYVVYLQKENIELLEVKYE
jgi:hypothetical protein